MANANFIKLAVSEVNKYVLNHLDKSDGTPDFDTFVVLSLIHISEPTRPY